MGTALLHDLPHLAAGLPGLALLQPADRQLRRPAPQHSLLEVGHLQRQVAQERRLLLLHAMQKEHGVSVTCGQ